MYDFDLIKLECGAVHADIFNVYSGISMLHHTFRGPFKTIRANLWANRYCRILDVKWPAKDVWGTARTVSDHG